MITQELLSQALAIGGKDTDASKMLGLGPDGTGELRVQILKLARMIVYAEQMDRKEGISQGAPMEALLFTAGLELGYTAALIEHGHLEEP